MATIPKRRPMRWEREEIKATKKKSEFNYSTTRWTQASIRHRRSNPLCVECLKKGKPIPAYCTDHIIPISAGSNPWDESNWQSLCLKCHSSKSYKETLMNGMKYKREQYKDKYVIANEMRSNGHTLMQIAYELGFKSESSVLRVLASKGDGGSNP